MMMLLSLTYPPMNHQVMEVMTPVHKVFFTLSHTSPLPPPSPPISHDDATILDLPPHEPSGDGGHDPCPQSIHSLRF